ncbi:MAG: hypothetical protein R2771_02490 [Saprospiraceae bacterium]
MKNKYSLVYLILIFATFSLVGQSNVIKVKNPSFESIPNRGKVNYFYMPYWDDCAAVIFPNETSPDIHSSDTDFFDVRHDSYDGETYIGLVTRENYESWEMITQKLDEPMIMNKCYEFSIYISKSDVYMSGLSGLSMRRQ